MGPEKLGIPDNLLHLYRLFHRIWLKKMTCFNANMSKKTGKKPPPPPPSKGGQKKYDANWNSIVQWSVMSGRPLGTHIHSGNTGLGTWQVRMTFTWRLTTRVHTHYLHDVEYSGVGFSHVDDRIARKKKLFSHGKWQPPHHAWYPMMKHIRGRKRKKMKEDERG